MTAQFIPFTVACWLDEDDVETLSNTLGIAPDAIVAENGGLTGHALSAIVCLAKQNKILTDGLHLVASCADSALTTADDQPRY
jgi:hypothetical protein